MKKYPITLVELLVVASILSLLILLLQPSLVRALETARRSHCLNDRRHNGIAILSFAGDFGDLIPHATAFWRGTSNTPADPELARKVMNMGDRIFGYTGMSDGSNIMSAAYMEVASMICAWGGDWNGKSLGITLPLGTLVRYGYISEPKVLVCPDLDRSYHANAIAYGGLTPIIWFDLKENLSKAWEYLLSNEVTYPDSALRMRSGLATHFFVNEPDKGFSIPMPKLRVSYYANNWQNDGISAIWVTCLNTQNVWSSKNPSEWSLSHGGEGLNALYYDGGARWIDMLEVIDDGSAGGWMPSIHSVYQFHYMGSSPSIGTLHTDNFSLWPRKHSGFDR
ncbi:MAG: hypothetical protein HQL31_09440 [Planctomycetes bacterium]|nr:hypothetical protein [Planctomycetota bacterium]